MGRVVDRFGILKPLGFGGLMLSCGYIAIYFVGSYWQFVIIQAVMIGMLGSAVTFAPLIADITHWFLKRRIAPPSWQAAATWRARSGPHCSTM